MLYEVITHGALAGPVQTADGVFESPEVIGERGRRADGAADPAGEFDEHVTGVARVVQGLDHGLPDAEVRKPDRRDVRNLAPVLQERVFGEHEVGVLARLVDDRSYNFV